MGVLSLACLEKRSFACERAEPTLLTGDPVLPPSAAAVPLPTSLPMAPTQQPQVLLRPQDTFGVPAPAPQKPRSVRADGLESASARVAFADGIPAPYAKFPSGEPYASRPQSGVARPESGRVGAEGGLRPQSGVARPESVVQRPESAAPSRPVSAAPSRPVSAAPSSAAAGGPSRPVSAAPSQGIAIAAVKE